MELEKTIEAIQHADAAEIDFLLDTALRRKRDLNPDWELLYFAHPKNAPVQDRKSYDQVYAYLTGKQE